MTLKQLSRHGTFGKYSLPLFQLDLGLKRQFDEGVASGDDSAEARRPSATRKIAGEVLCGLVDSSKDSRLGVAKAASRLRVVVDAKLANDAV